MKIPIYDSLSKKKVHFEHNVIDSKTDLDTFLQKWNKKDDNNQYIFRGVNEANFKLFNSAQRYWMIEELSKFKKQYTDFIEDEIQYAKNFQNNLLIKFYKAFGHTAYDLSILSFLQHYGAPTPLLDFTYNLDCAIFFALDNLKHYPSDDIGNYFSIYAIGTSSWEFISILDHIKSSTEQIESIIFSNSHYDIDSTDAQNNISNLNFSTFQALKLFYMPGYTPNGTTFKIPSLPTFKLVYNQHNLNIINQEGLFVFNNDPTHPLEDYFNGITDFNRTFNLPKIQCWDIHKSFNEYLLEYLKNLSPSIDRNFMYPQEEFIALNAFKDFKKL